MPASPEETGGNESSPEAVGRRLIKELKNGYDNAALSSIEPTLRWLLILERGERYRRIKAAIAHQLALRHERRDEMAKAYDYYVMALEFTKPTDALTRARVLRDFAMFYCKVGECAYGLQVVDEVLPLHVLDLAAAKGDADREAKGNRQQRVSEGYVWRVQLLAGVETDSALMSLYNLALYESSDFHIRDQHFLVAFTLQHAPMDMKPRLEAKQLAIRVKRKNLARSAVLLTKLGIDTSFVITRKVVSITLSPIFRKE